MAIFNSYFDITRGYHLVIFASASWTVPRGIWHWYLIYFSLWEKSRPKGTKTICRCNLGTTEPHGSMFCLKLDGLSFQHVEFFVSRFRISEQIYGDIPSINHEKTTVRIRWDSFLHPDLGGNRFVTPSPVDATLQVYQVKKWSSHIWWVICWGNNHVWWHMMRGGNVVPWRWRGSSRQGGQNLVNLGGGGKIPMIICIYIYIH